MRLQTTLLLPLLSLPLFFACVGDNNSGNDAGPDQSAPDTGGKDSAPPTDSGPTDSGGDANDSGSCATDAGQAVCSGQCVTLATSGTNCGACGHDCLGGTCTAGVCGSVTLATLTHSVYRLATDGTHVAFTVNDVAGNGGGVYTINVTGTSQTPTYVHSTDNGGVVAISSGTVYFIGGDATNSDILTLYKGTAGTASSGSSTGKTFGFPTAWAVTGIVLNSGGTTLGYVEAATSASAGQVGSCPTSNFGSCTSSSLTETFNPGGIATDDTNLYWSDVTASRIKKIPIGITSAASDFVTNSQATPGHIVYDSGYVYWSGDGSGTLLRSPTTSPTQSSVASTNAPNGLAADAKYVYLSGGLNEVDYVAVTGGTPTKLVDANVSGEMTRDSKALYYFNIGDKTIRKVALP